MPKMRPGDEPGNKNRTFKPEPLSQDEVAAMLRLCSTRYPTGIRNRALITVLYRAGLRVSEALALKVSDIDFKHARATKPVLSGSMTVLSPCSSCG
jgi:site-specific recombinase XerD